MLYVEPGSPWQNGYVEAFHSHLRDKLRDREVFVSLLEARVVSREWRKESNEVRPHSALGYQAPMVDARGCSRAVRENDAASRVEPTTVV